MQERTTTYAVSGVAPPQSLEEQNQTHIPILGKAIFAGIAKATSRLARKKLARVLRQARTTSEQELKWQVTLWFVFDKLVASLATEATATIPEHARTLARKRFQINDCWDAFSIFGAWQLRECQTKRVSPHSMPPTPTPSPRKLTRKRTKVTRSTILHLMNGYKADRANPTYSFAEHQNNNPLVKFHNAVCQAISRNQSSTTQSFPGTVRIDIESNEWPNHSSFFQNIPFEPRLGLAFSMLLRLRTEHMVWMHRLDFEIEPMLRDILQEARRQELIRQIASMNANELKNFSRSARSLYIASISVEIIQLLEVGMPLELSCNNLNKRILAALEKAASLGPKKLGFLFSKDKANDFNRSSNSLKSRWIKKVAKELRQQDNPPNNLNLLEDLANLPYSSTDGEKLLNAAFAAMHGTLEASILNVGDDFDMLGSLCSIEMPKLFSSPPSWSVAIPIKCWSVATAQEAAATEPEVLVSIGEIEKKWRPGRDLAPAIGEQEASQNFKTTKSTLCLVATGIHAPDSRIAFREAKSRLDATLCGLWFLDDRRFMAQLANHAFVRQDNDGSVMHTFIREPGLFASRPVQMDEYPKLAELASKITIQFTKRHQMDVWRRLSEGMGFLRSAFSATLQYERYLYLWMALEALLNNLSPEEDSKYERVAPIGTRVAYRASLVLVPEPTMAGRTFGEARWLTTLELGALYYLRNKAVHEGRRNPPMDEIILKRFQDKVVFVFETISYNAFRFGMRRIEELLAWCDNQHPESDIIPQR